MMVKRGIIFMLMCMLSDFLLWASPLTHNTPFNGKTHVYRINGTEFDYSKVFDSVILDSVIQCGIICVTDMNCLAAIYQLTEKLCMVSSEALDNIYMSPSYQDAVGELGSVLYVDLQGWDSTATTTTTTTTTITTTTTVPPTTTTTISTTTTPGTTTIGLIEGIDFILGDRVQRGPDWSWGNQDGNTAGTITNIVGFAPGWIQVTWDNGYTNDYRNGADGKIDLMKL